MNFYRFLDTNGDGTGTKSAIANYSDGGSGVTDFFISPPEGEMYYLERMTMYLEDFGGVRVERYASTLGPLAVGISILVLTAQDATKVDLTDGVPITQNSHWARICDDFAIHLPASNNAFSGVMDLRIKGEGILLTRGDKFVVRVNDDLSGLIDHTFMVQGKSMDNPYMD